MTVLGYEIVLFYSEEDKVFIARACELEGVVTHGETPAEARAMVKEAIKLHLASLEKAST